MEKNYDTNTIHTVQAILDVREISSKSHHTLQQRMFSVRFEKCTASWLICKFKNGIYLLHQPVNKGIFTQVSFHPGFLASDSPFRSSLSSHSDHQRLWKYTTQSHRTADTDARPRSLISLQLQLALPSMKVQLLWEFPFPIIIPLG